MWNIFNFGNRNIRQSLNFARPHRLLPEGRPVTASPRAACYSYKTMGKTRPCSRYHYGDCGVDFRTWGKYRSEARGVAALEHTEGRVQGWAWAPFCVRGFVRVF